MADGARRLLLVEDEAIVALNTRMILEQAGFSVGTAHSGEEAVEAVREHPDLELVLMDIDLGRGIDGTEAARRILAFRRVPIVFLTSHTEQSYVERVKAITRYGYVVKHSGEFVLREAIAMAFELFDATERLERENEARRRAEEEMRESEERYRLLVEHSDEAITLFDVEGRVLLMNARAAANLGGQPSDFIGLTLTEFLPPEEGRRATEGVRLVATTATGSVTEWDVPIAGERRWFNSRIQPIPGDDGVVRTVLSLSTDITERVMAERAVADERDRLAHVIESSGLGTWEWNAATGETRFNERWAEIIGYTLEELEPISIETWRRFAHPVDLEESDRRLADHVAGRTDAYSCEIRMRHRDGSCEPLRVYGTHQEITGLKRVEEALRHELAELRDGQ